MPASQTDWYFFDLFWWKISPERMNHHGVQDLMENMLVKFHNYSHAFHSIQYWSKNILLYHFFYQIVCYFLTLYGQRPTPLSDKSWTRYFITPLSSLFPLSKFLNARHTSSFIVMVRTRLYSAYNLWNKIHSTWIKGKNDWRIKSQWKKNILDVIEAYWFYLHKSLLEQNPRQ